MTLTLNRTHTPASPQNRHLDGAKPLPAVYGSDIDTGFR
jgi:hypothetical protein